MKYYLLTLALFITTHSLLAQRPNFYQISFNNAVHHEATIEIDFYNLESDTISLRMSRTSPGRYALHEFAKNIYNVKVTDSEGKELKVVRPDPYQWQVTGYNGDLHVSYTLYANRGDGTYSQIDETHAHLNIPATFMYIPEQRKRPVQVQFHTREDLGWKVATQLKPLKNGLYYAPDLDYFMDSPTEISNHDVRSFTQSSNGKNYTINFVLHHQGTAKELDDYFEMVKAIVKQEKAVFGELPDFDYGAYHFIACYLPNVSGDGMEHRNSTILTSQRSLKAGGMQRNIGTVAHEFFHAWNVERIRPASLEPFDYENANMSGALWFAEGFTSYYTGLIQCRAGIISPHEYIERLTGTFNYVWNSPGRKFFTPVEMSYQAPFVDAATSVDDVNRTNTFISYYSYGSMLGLALDLSLRNYKEDLNLDGFMKLVWKKFGKDEINYSVNDLRNTLNEYAGGRFGNDFFGRYILKSGMPDFEMLFYTVGIVLEREETKAYWGFDAENVENHLVISKNTKINSPAYKAGLEKGDIILAVDNKNVFTTDMLKKILTPYKPGDSIAIKINRNGVEKTVNLIFESDPSWYLYPIEKATKSLSGAMRKKRNSWLNPK
jgi:predicted metalloprotease with PDZ domain